MLMTLAALMPVILVIASGYVIARTGVITGEQWRGVEQLAYYALFPAVLFRTISQADFTSFPTLNMGGALFASILVMAAILLAIRPLIDRFWGVQPVRFTSIFQGTLRWNAMVALAIADNLVGEAGLAIMAVAMVFMIPILNVLAILVLARYASGAAPSGAKVLRDLFTNPLIVSIGLGGIFNLLGLGLPSIVDETLEIFSRGALPLGIICVGAGLELRSLRRPGPALALGAFLRPVFMPLLAFGFAMLFGVEGPALVIIVIASSVPCAGNAYILSRQMGGDAKLMAEIITLQTLAATVTMPLALLIFT